MVVSNMAENTQEFPPKGVMRSSISIAKTNLKAKKRNRHIPVQYQGKPWLLGVFSHKDGSTGNQGQLYNSLKAQITALSSAIVRMVVYKGSPAYLAAYDESQPYGQFGFITKQIQNKLEGSDLFWAIHEMLKSKYQYRGDSEERFKAPVDILSNLKCCIHLRQTALRFLKILYFGVNEDVSGANRVNGKKIPEMTKLLQEKLFNASFDERNIQDLKKSLYDFDRFFYEFVEKLKNFYKLESAIETFFAISGLPELVAVSYFLGEFDFKLPDVLLDEKNQLIRRIDHERNLWPMVRGFLGQVAPNSKKFPGNNTTARQHGLYARDIDHFPDRVASDENFPCEKWFIKHKYLRNCLESEAARHKAYQTWLFLVLIPDEVY